MVLSMKKLQEGGGIGALDGGLIAQNSAIAVLLTTLRITTWLGTGSLSSASGFFFRRDKRLFLVTNRHVFSDAASNHYPDRVEIELHTDAQNLTRYVVFSIPLYAKALSLWRQADDSAGTVDVAVIEIDMAHLPQAAVLQTFEPAHLETGSECVMVGDALTVIGYPLGFQDTIHHLAVARGATIASAYGVRFQQQGYFLTDARTHRGSSGSPVLRRRRRSPHPETSLLSWQLLGIHSTRMDMSTRDLVADESLGLNCVWYADVLTALTQ
jgi:S1-C subfamily serine protease